MEYRLPGLMLTGASGFEGRNFIEAADEKFSTFLRCQAVCGRSGGADE